MVKFVAIYVVKLKNCQIGTIIGVVVYIDHLIMILVCDIFWGGNMGEMLKKSTQKTQKYTGQPDSRTRGPAAPTVLVYNIVQSSAIHYCTI